MGERTTLVVGAGNSDQRDAGVPARAG